jgi:Protein of unknown function (DUF5672)
MNKLDLPTVTLVCADCVDTMRAVAVLEHCKDLCNFGAVKLLTSLDTDYPHEKIPQLNSLNDYSAFCLKNLHRHIDTPHMLVIQHDGFVINPDAWQPHWLNCDYIGPLFLQETIITDQTMGSGGFSFRSKALMAACDELLPPWDGKHSYDFVDTGNNWGHEDGVITKHLRVPLMAKGFRFATVEDGALFAFGGNQHCYCATSFGFHGFWQEVVDRMPFLVPPSPDDTMAFIRQLWRKGELIPDRPGYLAISSNDLAKVPFTITFGGRATTPKI